MATTYEARTDTVSGERSPGTVPPPRPDTLAPRPANGTSSNGTDEPDFRDEPVTMGAAVEMFFGDLRLAPRSKKTYRHGITKFLRHLTDHEGLDPDTAPVTAITADHVTAFASLLVPEDVRTPEEVSRMRTAQNNLSALRKFCAYLAAYDLHPTLATDRLRVRIAAMMPRFMPPPPDVKLLDLEQIVAYIRDGHPAVRPQAELRRLKVKAMVLFLFRTGVRVSELCALRRRDVDLAEGQASIYRAKGGKSRTVHFDAETAESLVAYWTARGDGCGGSAHTLLSPDGITGCAGDGRESPYCRTYRRRALPGDRDRERGHAALLPPWFGDGAGPAPGTGIHGPNHPRARHTGDHPHLRAQGGRRGGRGVSGCLWPVPPAAQRLDERAKFQEPSSKKIPFPSERQGGGGIGVFLGES